MCPFPPAARQRRRGRGSCKVNIFCNKNRCARQFSVPARVFRAAVLGGRAAREHGGYGQKRRRFAWLPETRMASGFQRGLEQRKKARHIF